MRLKRKRLIRKQFYIKIYTLFFLKENSIHTNRIDIHYLNLKIKCNQIKIEIIKIKEII